MKFRVVMEFERNAKLNKRDSKLKQRFTGYLITPFFLMLEKQQKNKKGKKVHAVFNQVGFILILYGEYNGNLKKKYIPGNLFVVISLSLYLRLKITSQQVLSMNFKPK